MFGFWDVLALFIVCATVLDIVRSLKSKPKAKADPFPRREHFSGFVNGAGEPVSDEHIVRTEGEQTLRALKDHKLRLDLESGIGPTRKAH